MNNRQKELLQNILNSEEDMGAREKLFASTYPNDIEILEYAGLLSFIDTDFVWQVTSLGKAFLDPVNNVRSVSYGGNII